jgi:tagatose-1,6-bisphosphate aldolase
MVLLQWMVGDRLIRCALVGGPQHGFQPGKGKWAETVEQGQDAFRPALAGTRTQTRSRRRQVQDRGRELEKFALGIR